MNRLGIAAGLTIGILGGGVAAATMTSGPDFRGLFISINLPWMSPPAVADVGHGETQTEHSASKPQAENHDAHAEPYQGGGHDDEDGNVRMASEQVASSKIDVRPAGAGLIRKRLRVPGTIIPDRNRVGRVPSKVVGTVVELKKRLGDHVSAGEVIAILDSREVADAKSEYIAALVNFRLQDTLYQREKTLFEKQVSSEQRLLRAEATYQETLVRRDVARQKLSALGVSEDAVARLSDAKQSATALERYEIKAPIGGRIVEQLVDIGTPMGGEGQAHELYAITDLARVWVELTVSTQDLPQIREGQRLTIEASGVPRTTDGEIIFTSPMLNQDTRSARVVASVDNQEGVWRPGSFVTAEVMVGDTKADVAIPKTAIQNIKGQSRVFVRTNEGFEVRPVTVGHDDGKSVAITSGLKAGEFVAIANTFLLKAELGKSEAEHDH
ncbi:MAG: efflux RND transporter periplasmic adaptor subunit [Hyphomicrobium sp.]|uniref:efflux RND transporter periplasmic adaptor subunit n=1 Tax=Hyphomicrobium sp. TaxID=82 RepID=UPI00356745C7